MSSEPLVLLNDVFFSWKSRDSMIPALQHCTLELEDLPVQFVCGPSASGKSTLSLLLARMVEPDSGSIYFHSSLHNPASVALVLQYPEELFFENSVEEEWAAMKIAEEKIIEICRDFGLDWSAIRTQNPFSLSQGTSRLLGIALQASRKSRLLILDEPTVGLDFSHRSKLIAYLKKILSSGTQILFITHDLRLLGEFDGRVALMKHGRVGWRGSTQDLLADQNLLSDYSLQ